MLDFTQILSVTLILFSVIDILGSIPIIIDLRKKVGHVQSEKATIVAGILMILFLFAGDNLLALFGIDVGSFAIAGSIIMFIIGMEMILGRAFFKNEPTASNNTSVVPIAFPLIAGAGTLTTLISIKAEYDELNILVGIIINLGFVYLVLKSTNWLSENIGKVKILDASWHMPNSNRNALVEFNENHIESSIFFDLDKNSNQKVSLPHMLPELEEWEKIVSKLEKINNLKRIKIEIVKCNILSGNQEVGVTLEKSL